MERSILILLFVTICNIIHAQSPWGFYGGVNYGGFKGKGVENAISSDFTHSSTTNFNFGVRGYNHIYTESDKIDFKGVSFDLGISQRAGKFNIETAEEELVFGNNSSFKYTYFDLAFDYIISKPLSKNSSLSLINGFYWSAPIIGKYNSKWYADKLPPGITLQDVLDVFDEKEESEIDLLGGKEGEKSSSDLGLRTGLALNVGKFSLRTQYNFGIIDITGRHEENFMNRFWSINLFYSFWRVY